MNPTAGPRSNERNSLIQYRNIKQDVTEVKEPLSFARDLYTIYISREALTVLCSVVKYAGGR